MAEFNFGDSYRAAGLTISPDVLKTRQEPFDKLRKEMTPKMAIELVRLYYKLPMPDGTDWFRDAFAKTDPSFSLIDNAREAAVIAAGLLEATTADDNLYAALGVVAAQAGGLRKPTVRAELLDAMRQAIQAKALGRSQRPPVDENKIKLPAKSAAAKELTALAAAPDLNKASTLLKQVSEESRGITEALATQVFNVVQPLAIEVRTLREETEMLWWYVGSWSRLLEKPFADLDLGLAAVMAGIDMAELSKSVTGPAAARAIFYRILSNARKSKGATISTKEAVDALPQQQLDQLTFVPALGTMFDVCPILAAFAKAKEIGSGSAWHASYTKVTGLKATVGLAPLELAMQAYYERLLLRAFT